MSIALRMKYPWTAKWPIDIRPEHALYAESMVRAIEEFLGSGKCHEIVTFFRLKSDDIDGVSTLTVALDTKIPPHTSQAAALNATLTMLSISSNTASRIAAQAAAQKAAASVAEESRQEMLALPIANQEETQQVVEQAEEEGRILVRVFDNTSIQAVVNMHESREKHVQDHAAALLSRLKNDMGYRELRPVPQIEALSVLDNQFPNFGEAYEAIQREVLLALLGDYVLRLPPLLFVGPPGVGKTKFISTLADAVGVPFKFLNVASLQSESVLGGSEMHWGNTRPGEVFNMIVGGKCANPIFMLDELDKAGRSGRMPLAALFQLLEREQASRFEDMSYPGFVFDASHINWFASANETSSIDPAILSRFHVLEIKAPTREEGRQILQYMYDEIISSNAWGHHMSKSPLSETVLDELEKMPTRDAKRSLQAACAYTLSDDRNVINAVDVQVKTSRRKNMGFI